MGETIRQAWFPFRCGQPVVMKSRTGGSVYGRIVRLCGEPFHGCYPQFEFSTPGGSSFFTGAVGALISGVSFRPLSRQELPTLREFEVAALHSGEWYGGRWDGYDHA